MRQSGIEVEEPVVVNFAERERVAVEDGRVFGRIKVAYLLDVLLVDESPPVLEICAREGPTSNRNL